MKNSFLILLVIFACKPGKEDKPQTRQYATIPVLGMEDDHVTDQWTNALKTRQSQAYINELRASVRPLTEEENGWINLVRERGESWNALKDSLKIPFGDIYIHDTTYVLLGYQGSDDGFTYQYQTVCFDVTALSNEYGLATDEINGNRMDRLFAHEYTHLLHKEWARQHNLEVRNFKDSILWECLYEGIGMYRSMSPKWFPVDGQLSAKAAETFTNLYPVFTDKMIRLHTSDTLTNEEKVALHRNLSRGSMTQKWGALPVGVWIAMEANGDDRNLQPIIDKGPEVVLELAAKYLTGESKEQFNAAMNQ